MKKSLFHFTDAQAVYSILSNRKIWLTDLRFLNDSRELHDGIDIFSKALKKPMHGLFSNYDFEDESTDYFEKAFSDTVSFGIDEDPIFVFSLSRMGNILSQWRAYGSYAIEFDEEVLKSEVPALKECVYIHKDKYMMADSAVTGALGDISQEMGKNNGSPGIVGLDSLSKIMEIAAMFKDSGFSEEQEVRIIAQANDGGEAINFRHKSDKLIPYLEMEISLDCIKAIHIGPMSEQKLAYTSMAAFVRKIEKEWQTESSVEYELDVKKSSIPFRGSI